GEETIEAGAREEEAEVEREIAGLWAVRLPGDARAPVVEAKEPRQGEQQQRDDDLDGAGADHRGRIVRRRGRIVDDDVSFGRGHWFLGWRGDLRMSSQAAYRPVGFAVPSPSCPRLSRASTS